MHKAANCWVLVAVSWTHLEQSSSHKNLCIQSPGSPPSPCRSSLTCCLSSSPCCAALSNLGKGRETVGYTERQFTRCKQHKVEIRNKQPPDHTGVRDIIMHNACHSSHCFHIHEIIKTFLSPLSPRHASPGYNKQGWINCTIHWWTKWSKVLLLYKGKSFALNSVINSNYGSCCINDNETLSQAEWECWREQRRPHAAASKECLSFTRDRGICLHNKLFSFGRYLAWQKGILVQFTHSTEPAMWLFSLSVFPPSQVSYIFVIYIEIKSFLNITGTTSIDLISYHCICRQRQDFPARHSNVSMQDTIMEVKSQLMWQQMSYTSIFHLKVTHSEIPEGPFTAFLGFLLLFWAMQPVSFILMLPSIF